jgi:tetratricopeptide (TPR) repeat protein
MPGCGGASAAFQSEYQAIRERAAGQELFNALLDLDQKYPDRLDLKTEIGAYLLAAGDVEKARLYLTRAKSLAGRSRGGILKASLFAHLASLALAESRYQDAIDCANTSLRENSRDPSGVIFIRAKAYLGLGVKSESLADFLEGWNDARSAMVAGDYRIASSLMADQGRLEEARAVLFEYQRRYAFVPGTGLMESMILEKLGRLGESVLCAFKELEYQRYSAGAEDAAVLANLWTLSRALSDGNAKAVAETLIAFVQGRWSDVVRDARQLESLFADPFARYVLLSARLESADRTRTAGAAAATIMEYQALEPSLRGLAGFYYHLWRGMKKGGGAYTLVTMQAILEKCILLGPTTAYARETRREIGRLLGLAPTDAEKLLLGAELDAIASAVVSRADLSALNSVIELLAIPDNSYEMAGVMVMRQLKRIESVDSFLHEQAGSAHGRLKERLGFILSE